MTEGNNDDGPVMIKRMGWLSDASNSIWLAIRRSSRRGLQYLRPLVQPLLYRFEARIGTAVSQTGILQDISRIDARIDELLAALRQVVVLTEHTDLSMADMHSELAGAMEKLDTLVGPHATKLEVLVGSHAAKLEALSHNILNTRMTVLRMEEANEQKAKRISLIHEALCTFVLPMDVKVDQIGQRISTLEERMIDQSIIHTALTKFALPLDARIEGIRTRISDIEQMLSFVNPNISLLLDFSQHLVERNTIMLSTQDMAVRTPNGYVVVPGEDVTLLLYLAEGQGHELGTIKVLEALLDPGDAAVDVGAHVGLMSVPMARRIGPAGSLRSFEPRPQTAACLRRTLLLNGLKEWTTVSESAAGDRSGRVGLNLGPSTSLSSIIALPGFEASIEVDLIRLDDVIPSSEVITVLKMDVEGAELAVLSGMHRVIKDNPDIVIVAEFDAGQLRRSDVAIRDWVAAFCATGLDTMLQIDERNGSCNPVTTAELELASCSMNLVFGRHSGPRLKRLKGVKT